MKRAFLRLFDRLTDRAGDRVMSRLIYRNAPLIGRPFLDSFNIVDVAFYEAAKSSATYWRNNMLNAKAVACQSDLLSHALGLVRREGLFLEFGVATGRTITQIAAQHNETHIFGFDSFDGLPEDWRPGFPKGEFAGPMPAVPSNVCLVKGLFAETLPRFVTAHPEPVAFLHVDCDLYSSTKCIFDSLQAQISSGCVIVFDEYFNYPDWEQHEHKAFMEFIAYSGLNFRYEAFVPGHQQVCAIIV